MTKSCCGFKSIITLQASLRYRQDHIAGTETGDFASFLSTFSPTDAQGYLGIIYKLTFEWQADTVNVLNTQQALSAGQEWITGTAVFGE